MNLIKKTLLVMTIIIVSQILSVTLGDFQARSHTYNNTTLPYRLFVPASYNPSKSYPIILCLHGANERGTNNSTQLDNGMINWADAKYQAQNPCFVVAPQSAIVWADFDWTSGVYKLSKVPINNSMATVMDMLDSLIREFNIDTCRQYITGLSMGGCGTWDAISRFPNRFAAAAPVCGAVDTTMASTIKNISIWSFHGADDGVISVIGTRRIVANLESLGVAAVYTDCHLAPNCPTRRDSIILQQLQSAKLLYSEYCCIRHDAWRLAYTDSLLFKWMLLQSKPRDLRKKVSVIVKDSATKQIVITEALVTISQNETVIDSDSIKSGIALLHAHANARYIISVTAAGYIARANIELGLGMHDTVIAIGCIRQNIIGIDIKPDSFDMIFKYKQPLSLYGVYSDQTRILLGTLAKSDWLSRSPNLVAVNDTGLLTSNTLNGSCFIVANVPALGFSDSAKVTIVNTAPTIRNSSFESAATDSDWTMEGGAAIESNRGPYGQANAPNGTKVARLQSGWRVPDKTVISQKVTFPAGFFKVVFYASNRVGIGQQRITVRIDSLAIGSVSPMLSEFSLFETDSFAAYPGVHHLTFEGSNLKDDNTGFIDSIAIAIASPKKPFVEKVFVSDLKEISIQLNKCVELTSVTNIANYSIDDNRMTVVSATLGGIDSVFKRVIVVTTAEEINPDSLHSIVLSNIKDFESPANTIASDRHLFRVKASIGAITVTSERPDYYIWSWLFESGPATVCYPYSNPESEYLHGVEVPWRYSVCNVPLKYARLPMLQTWRWEVANTSSNLISFDINKTMDIFIARADAFTTVPTWFDGFVNTGDDITVRYSHDASVDFKFSIYKKTFPKGTVILGGNAGFIVSDRPLMYFMFIKDPQDSLFTPLEDDASGSSLTTPEIAVSPNPFNPSVNITLSNVVGAASLRILDIQGKVVADLSGLVRGSQHGGVCVATWNATGMPSGMYLVCAVARGKALNRRVILLK